MWSVTGDIKFKRIPTPRGVGAGELLILSILCCGNAGLATRGMGTLRVVEVGEGPQWRQGLTKLATQIHIQGPELAHPDPIPSMSCWST